MSTKQAQVFAFVSMNSDGKTKRRDRKRVRSHCMTGKNLRIGTQSVTDVETPDAADQQELACRSQQQRSLAASRFASYNQCPKEAGGMISITLPLPPASDLDLIAPPGEVDAESRVLLFNFLTKAKEVMHPLNICVEFAPNRLLWLQYLAHDPSWLHPIMFSVSAISCILRQVPIGTSCRLYWGKAINFLRKRLSNVGLATQDSTILCICNLVVLFSVLENFDMAQVHLKGLADIVRLRGGLKKLQGNSRLCLKLARLDLSYCLYSGHRPYFSAGLPAITSSSLTFPKSSLFRHNFVSNSLTELGSSDLVALFVYLQDLCTLINSRTSSLADLSPIDFHNRVSTAQYSLLRLQGSLNTSLAESFRLAMLGFLVTTFQIPDTKLHLPHFSQHFRDCLSSSEPYQQSHHEMILWMQMIGTMSVFAKDDLLLQQRWLAFLPSGTTWFDFRNIMKTFLWIDTIHDRPGLYAFKVLNSSEFEGYKRKNSSAYVWATGWAGNSYEI